MLALLETLGASPAQAHCGLVVEAAETAGEAASSCPSVCAGDALLGHAEVVRRLIAAGAPLDHVNNLHWTALIEAVIP